MDLRSKAERDVKHALATYGPDFIKLRSALELAVQEAGAHWEHPNLELSLIDACVRSGHVRQLAAGHLLRGRMGEVTLGVKLVPFAGIHLYTPGGQRIRTRSRPVTGRDRRPMRPDVFHADPLFDLEIGDQTGEETEQSEVLFGHAPSAEPYELDVLLDLDVITKTLTMASLAAIDWGPDDKGKMIYYEEEIPASTIALPSGPNGDGTPVPPGAEGPADDGFGDFLADEGDETGIDPA